MIDEPAKDSERRLAELEAERADAMLRDLIISRLEQLQREGLWSDARRAEFDGLLQLTARFPPEHRLGEEWPQAHSVIQKNRMN